MLGDKIPLLLIYTTGLSPKAKFISYPNLLGQTLLEGENK